jgi:hypothetical protein
MFRRSRKPGSASAEVSASNRSETATEPSSEPTQYQAKLRDWRRAAQQVTLAWNAWLAAEGAELSVCYRAWVRAFAEEEQAAAELERIADLAGSGECVIPTAC